MNIDFIKRKIAGTEYSFLREEKELKDNIILLTLGGSYSYGTNVSTIEHESDIDVRGIRLNSKEEILTMNISDKPYEHKELDVVIYPLKQIVKLLVNCNPNVLEMFGSKEDHLIYISEEGRILKDNISKFLSKGVYDSFGGYAISQLRRLENALARDNYPKERKEVHMKEAMERAMSSFNNKYKDLGDGLKLYIDKSTKADFEKEIYMNLDLKDYPLRDFHGIYSEMTNIIKDYSKLNKRNRKKDNRHLLKHAMHLIRLLIMGEEILLGKGIHTYREDEKELLLDIRNGKYTYEEIFEMVKFYEEKFEDAYKITNLPDKVDSEGINSLVMEINNKVLSR